jgi:hypothetical protein
MFMYYLFFIARKTGMCILTMALQFFRPSSIKAHKRLVVPGGAALIGK